MKGTINEKEVKRLAKKQQDTKRVQKEWGKAFKSFQPKPKNP
jgi:hypothetical protein